MGFIKLISIWETNPSGSHRVLLHRIQVNNKQHFQIILTDVLNLICLSSEWRKSLFEVALVGKKKKKTRGKKKELYSKIEPYRTSAFYILSSTKSWSKYAVLHYMKMSGLCQSDGENKQNTWATQTLQWPAIHSGCLFTWTAAIFRALLGLVSDSHFNLTQSEAFNLIFTDVFPECSKRCWFGYFKVPFFNH